MLLKLDLESEVPIYQQLVNAIMEGIATRKLAPNEALPSVRALAADIGVNMHTVNKAYQMLKNEGFLLIHRQKGVVVNPDLPAVDNRFLEKLNDNLKTLATEAICRGLTKESMKDRLDAIYQDILSQRGEHT